MSRNPPHAADRGDPGLRALAEKRLAESRTKGGAQTGDARELLHELQVHQVELEMQNETLRHAQTALQQSRDRYVDLYEFAPVGYLTLSREGGIAEINLAGAVLLGQERAKLLQRRFGRFVRLADRDRWERHFLRVIERGERRSCELALKRDDNSVLHVLVDCLRVAAADKEPQMRVALTDLTERHLAETERRASDARYRAVVQSANDAVVTIDSAGKVVDWNPSAERMFGYASDEIAGQSAACIVPERFRQRHFDGLARMAAGGASRMLGRTVELAGLRKDGREFPLELSLAPWQTGADRFYTAIMRDLSARKRIEEARAQLETQLRESQKMEALGTLAGGVAHDFNNALATIMGNVELARQDLGPAHLALESLDEIHKASERAKHLVDQILAFGRRSVLERKVISLAPVVEEAVRLLRAGLPAGVSVKAKCAPDAPLVLADANHIEQLLLNLCNNAWDATRGQSRQPAIEIELQAWEQAPGTAQSPTIHGELSPGRYARLTVRDNGSGMDETTRGHMFEPFFTTKPMGEGTGLGLAVVHGIAQEHHASIQVESRPGEGTAFFIHFPQTLSPLWQVPARAGKRDDEGAEPAPLPPADGKRVLYIDDDVSIVMLMTKLLQRKGYRVSGYDDPDEALAAMRADPGQFDLAVTDYNMPGATGLEVARALHEIRADLPIAIASGFITEELRLKAPAAGVSELVHKPNTAKELCEAIARLASSTRKQP